VAVDANKSETMTFGNEERPEFGALAARRKAALDWRLTAGYRHGLLPALLARHPIRLGRVPGSVRMATVETRGTRRLASVRDDSARLWSS
jgi:hypothetical protein